MQDQTETWPPLWMAHLERAHDCIGRALPILEEGEPVAADLEGFSAALLRSMDRLYAAFAPQGDQALAGNESAGALDEAIAALAPLAPEYPHLGEALAQLSAARAALLAAGERLVLLVPRPPQPVPDLRASLRNVPELFVLDRPVLLPRLRLPEPPAAALVEATEAPTQPRSFEEMEATFAALRDKHARRRGELREAAAAQARPRPAPAPAVEPRPGFVAAPRPAISELDFVHDKTRECFEEVCLIGTQRAPLLGDPWRSSLGLEKRMLAAIDSIAAMGPRAVARIEPLVRDSPITDPARLFGACMVLGCIEGRDALGAIERLVLSRLDDPACAAQVAAGLQLATHPLLPLMLRTWLGHPEASHRAVAIDVLGYRGLASSDELVRATADDPRVRAVALPWYALGADPGVRSAVEEALTSDDAALREAGARGLAASGHPHAASTLARMLENDADVAETVPWYLALVGAGDDAGVLLERAVATPTRALIQAVGWAGAGSAVPRLMALLRHKKADIRLAAAYALDRITGAGLWEEAEVMAEEIEVPDVPDPLLPDDGSPQPTGHEDRDPPEQPAPETIERPTTDVQRWSEWWQERRDHFAPDKRYRRGYPYSPLISLRELDGVWPATPVERRNLQLELVVRTGSTAVRVDPHDFVVVQEEAVRAWEEHATRASGSAGQWLRPTRR